MQRKETTVEAYLNSLPPDRQEALRTIRNVILKNLPRGYTESMNWGIISYGIPLERYSNTYNGQPLALAALASQKNYMSVYLMCVYGSDKMKKWFVDEYKKTGKINKYGQILCPF